MKLNKRKRRGPQLKKKSVKRYDVGGGIPENVGELLAALSAYEAPPPPSFPSMSGDPDLVENRRMRFLQEYPQEYPEGGLRDPNVAESTAAPLPLDPIQARELNQTANVLRQARELQREEQDARPLTDAALNIAEISPAPDRNYLRDALYGLANPLTFLRNVGVGSDTHFPSRSEMVADQRQRGFDPYEFMVGFNPVSVRAGLSDAVLEEEHGEYYLPLMALLMKNSAALASGFPRVAETNALGNPIRYEYMAPESRLFPNQRFQDILNRYGRRGGAEAEAAAELGAAEAGVARTAGIDAAAQQGALPASPQFPRLERTSFESDTRAAVSGFKIFKERGQNIPYSKLRNLSQEELYDLAPSGSQVRSDRFVELLEMEMQRKFNEVYNPRGTYTLQENKQQIPALMIDGELQKRANKKGLISKGQMAQFLNKGGLSTFDREVLSEALRSVSTTTGKKGQEFYNLNEVRREAADLLNSRFDEDEVQTYSRYGFDNLAGPSADVQDIGTQLIIADRDNPLAVNYIGKSSGHWTSVSPDVVAHYRGFQRTGESETLYIGEMQSDVAQRGRFLQDSRDYVKDFPRDLMAYEYRDGNTEFTYRFPPDAYNTFLGMRSTNQARNPQEIMRDAPLQFDADDLAPNFKEHLSEIASHGVMSPENGYLYDPDWWTEAANKLENLFGDFRGLNRDAKRITETLYQEVFKGYERANPQYVGEYASAVDFELPNIAQEMAIVADDIVEALEANDVNPPGTFTDANIASVYDEGVEKFQQLLETYEGVSNELAEVFTDANMRNVSTDLRRRSPLLNEDLQKAFVKNQDEFLLSQIIANNRTYDVIRFPTGSTTAAIQGYVNSPASVQRQIEATQTDLDNYNDAIRGAESQIDSDVGEFNGFPTLFRNGQLTDFGRQVEALGPGVQQLLFGAKVTDGGAPAFTEIGAYNNAKGTFYSSNFEQLRSDPSRTDFRIFNGTVDKQTQGDVHMYNFLTFMHKLRNGQVGRTLEQGVEQKLNDRLTAQFYPDADGRIVSQNFVTAVQNEDPALAEQLSEFARDYEFSYTIDALTADVANFNRRNPRGAGPFSDGEPVSVPRLDEQQYLDGSWARHPAYEAYVAEKGAEGFYMGVVNDFTKFLRHKGHFSNNFSQLTATTEETVDYYINNFVHQTLPNAALQGDLDAATRHSQEVKDNLGVLYGQTGSSLGWDAGTQYGMHQKPIYMPVGSTSPLQMTVDELRQFLVNKSNELAAATRIPSSTPPGTDGQMAVGALRRNIENLGYGLQKGATSVQNISAKETHLQNLQQQLDDIRRGVGVSDSHKTVMKSYDRLPKVAKKLGYDLKPVTDDYGNTWFELKVPQSVRNKSSEIRGYAEGGRIKIKKRKPHKLKKRKPHNLIKR